MPPKYYKRKGRNYFQNTPNEQTIIAQFDNEEHAINCAWPQNIDWNWRWNEQEDQPTMQKRNINSQYMMQPTMILPESQMKELPQNYQGHQLLLYEDDSTNLGLRYPLKHPDCSPSFRRIQSTEAMPYSCIGLVSFLYKEKPYFSTGTIVGSSVILTAANNCYSTKRKEENFHITFTPAFEGSKAHTFKVKKIHIPDEFKDQANPDRLLYNFCFIEVNTIVNLSTYFGCLLIRLQKENIRSEISTDYERDALLCGFVEGKQGQSPLLVEANVRITDEYDVLRYNTNTSERRLIGLGGSPIISEDLEIIGIHSYSSNKEGASSYGLASISYLLMNFANEKLKKDKSRCLVSTLLECIQFAPEDIFSLRVFRYRPIYNSIQEKELTFSNFMNRNDWSHITHLSFSGILDPRTLQIMLPVKLTNLEELHLQYNFIGDQGCQLLALANWNIVKLYIGHNNITNIGVIKLMNAGWRNLRTFAFGQGRRNRQDNMNQIQGLKQEGTTYYRWRRYSNSLEHEIKGSQYDSNVDVDDFFRLDYTKNRCFLNGKWPLNSFRDWKWIEHLDLKIINLCSKGCQWIYQAEFKHLCYLKLTKNQIGDSGIKWLSKGQWIKLLYINIGSNPVTTKCCRYLRIVNWPKAILKLNNVSLTLEIGIKQLLGTVIKEIQHEYRYLTHVQR